MIGHLDLQLFYLNPAMNRLAKGLVTSNTIIKKHFVIRFNKSLIYRTQSHTVENTFYTIELYEMLYCTCIMKFNNF